MLSRVDPRGGASEDRLDPGQAAGAAQAGGSELSAGAGPVLSTKARRARTRRDGSLDGEPDRLASLCRYSHKPGGKAGALVPATSSKLNMFVRFQ